MSFLTQGVQRKNKKYVQKLQTGERKNNKKSKRK